MRISVAIIMSICFQVWAGPGQANPEPHQLGPSPGAVPAAPGENPAGDVNGDGLCNIFDLLGLLQHLSEGLSYSQPADLDGDSRVDILDLAVLLKLLSPWLRQKEELEFAMVMGYHQIIGSKIFMVDGAEDCGYNFKPIPFKRRLLFYSNKPIEDFFLVFGEDTLSSPGDSLGYFYNPDTLTTLDSLEPKIITNIPWHLRLRAADGSTVDSSGVTECEIWFCVVVDGSYPFIGREIDFPLVLKGSPQCFTVFLQGFVQKDTLRIDLNPESADAVVYPDIDSLVAAIRTSIATHKNKDGKPGLESYIEFGPAVEVHSRRKTNRLALGGWGWNCYMVYPLDGNELLTDKLGFPGWLPREGCFVDLGYDILK